MANTPALAQPPKLLEQVATRIRVKHYSRRTELAYVDWIKRFIWHHGKRHPKDMGAAEVEDFLTKLATHLLQGGYDIRTVQELMGHTDVASQLDVIG